MKIILSLVTISLIMPSCVDQAFIFDHSLPYLTLFVFLYSSYLIFQNRKLLIRNKKTNEKLENSIAQLNFQKRLNELTINNSPCGVMLCTQQGEIKEVNQQMVEICDLPSIEAMRSIHAFTYLPFVQCGISDSFATIIDEKSTKVFDFFYISKWGKESNIKAVLTTIKEDEESLIAAFFIDITELENLKEKLKHSHKMESIGVLAGGIVHDFNNILGAIMGYSEMTMLDISDSNSSKDNITQVIMACHRAKDLVSHILSFTREEEREKKPVNVSQIIKETLNLLRASLPSTIEINVVTELDPVEDEDLVYANSTEIHQILMNLCTNASHAMEGIEGKLDIRLTTEDLSGETFKELNSGRYVKLSISDNGHGMDPETVKKIFDPYFTTKEAGHGTGMGLFVVQGIILNHGGVVKAESKSGEGSTFYIYLPAIESDREPIFEESNNDYQGSRERILLVDDEEQLITLGKQILERFDYNVTVSMDSTKALDMFKEKPFDFDLVITDMTMPGITGDILSKEILKIRPELPIIICTGYSDLINEEKAKEMGVRDYIMKPLGKKELGKVIRDVLDSNNEELIR